MNNVNFHKKKNVLNVLDSHETLNALETLLNKEQRVYFSRFGDGEYFAAIGKASQDHDVSKKLTQETHEAFLIHDNRHMMAINLDFPIEPGMEEGIFYPFNSNDSNFRNYLIGLNPDYKNKTFYSAVGLAYLFVFDSKRFVQFLDKYVRPKKKLYIGSIPKETAEKLLGPIDFHIPVPAKNAYDTIEKWWPEVEKLIPQVELVLPFAGIATEALHLRMWKKDFDVHSLDLGSIIDLVAGAPTRKWIRLKKHIINQVVLPEFSDKSLLTKIKYFWGELNFYFWRFRRLFKARDKG